MSDEKKKKSKKRKRLISKNIYEKPSKKPMYTVSIPSSLKDYPQLNFLGKLVEAENKVDQFLEDRRNRATKKNFKERLKTSKILFEIYHESEQVSPQYRKFTVHISGKIENCSNFPFTDFLEQLDVEFPSQSALENFCWEKDSSPNFVSKEISFDRKVRFRKKDAGFEARILIYLKHDPPLFKVNGKLCSFFGWKTNEMLELHSLSDVVNPFFEYFKKNDLYSLGDPTLVMLDSKLKNFFRRDYLHVNDFMELIKEYLKKPDPILFKYIVDLKKTEIEVVTKKIEMQKSLYEFRSLLRSDEDDFEIMKKNEEIELLMNEANYRERKSKFMKGFHENPVDFSYKLICSQSRAIGNINEDNDSLQYSDEFGVENDIGNIVSTIRN